MDKADEEAPGAKNGKSNIRVAQNLEHGVGP